jgi:hypothetical protein
MSFMTGTSLAARLLRAVPIIGMLSLLVLHIVAAPQQAQPATTSATSAAPAPAAAMTANHASAAANARKLAAMPDVRPLWNELTPVQQQALAPLAQEWNKLDSNHKEKWIAIGNKYPMMSLEQQKRLQENLLGWAKLTPEQHRIARESYARAKKLDPEQKTAKWQQYQLLPEEQKQKLADTAASKKRIANLPNPQNKTSGVEPLKFAKKPAAAYAPTPQTTGQASSPHVAPTSQPASTVAAPPVQTPSPSTAPAINK